MIFASELTELDPNKKTKEWMEKVVSLIRYQGGESILNAAKVRKGRAIMNSEQSMDNVKKMFNNSDELEKAGFEILKVCVMEQLKNILFGEKLRSEIKAYVDVADPTMERFKKEDRLLLQNKKLIEKNVNSLTKSIGMPPGKINNDDFNGNYTEFQQLGYDSNNPADIQTYFDIFYR